jgi:hypothetical protein
MRLKIGVRIKMICKLGLLKILVLLVSSYKLMLFELFPLIIDGDHGLASQGSHGLATGLCGGGGLDHRLPHQSLEVDQAWGLEWVENAYIGGD